MRKLLKKSFVLFLALCTIFALAACGMAKKNEAARDDSTSPMSPSEDYSIAGAYDAMISKEAYGVDGGAVAEAAPSAGEPGGYPSDGDEEKPVEPKSAGLITASAWNENDNYEFWLGLFIEGQSAEENGKFLDFYKNHNWGFDSTKRVKVSVKEGDEAVRGAAVACYDENGKLTFAARTDANGVAYLFPQTTTGKIFVKSGENSANAEFDRDNREIEVVLDGSEAVENLIQIMLVVDITGSMGDELSYLQAELADVVERIVATNPNTKIELALLFYGDDVDKDLKLTYHDFINVNDAEGIQVQVDNILSQKLAWGGDPPEAVDEALELAMEKSWNDSAATKIIFHLLDAPHHSNDYDPQRRYEERYTAAVEKAASMGVRICPVICSGADKVCEYVVRQASIYTGGTTIFVTSHSGIGGDHLDPEIPDLVVEKLNDLMVRLVNGYHTGVFAEPVRWYPNNQTQQ